MRLALTKTNNLCLYKKDNEIEYIKYQKENETIEDFLKKNN